MLLQIVVQLEKGHAGLYQHIGKLLVDFDDALHAMQRHHQRARLSRRWATIAGGLESAYTNLAAAEPDSYAPKVLALRAHPQGDTVLIGDRQDGLDLFDRDGTVVATSQQTKTRADQSDSSPHSRRRLVFIYHQRVGVTEVDQVGTRCNVLLAHNVAELP